MSAAARSEKSSTACVGCFLARVGRSGLVPRRVDDLFVVVAVRVHAGRHHRIGKAFVAAWLVRRFSPHASGSGIPHVESVLRGETPPAKFILLPVKFLGGVLAIGGGLALALCCDLRICTEGSRFGIPAAKLRLSTPQFSGGSYGIKSAVYVYVVLMAAVSRALGVPVWLHRDDLFLYEGIEAQGRMFGMHVEPLPPVDAFYDGTPIRFGDIEVLVHHTPGHCQGGVCLQMDRHLFVGDTLFAGSIGRTDFPRGDHATLLRSIREKLFPLGDDVVCLPGHGQPCQIGQERQTNPFLNE